MNKLPSFTLGDRVVGEDQPPFIIAEMSGNHNQSLDRALAIVDAAARSGAHAIKLQTYTADTMTIDAEGKGFRIDDPDSPWQGRSLHDLYQEAYTPWDWHEPIFARCGELGMICFSTPFDETAVDFLESLDAPCYKVASFENTDLPLIRKVAATGKPLIISTGMASIADLDETVRTARASGCGQLVLLKCTSNYPASPINSHLATIPHMSELFRCHVGLSDHTLGIGASVASIAFGAVIIERHFTLARTDGGVDSQFSLEPAEMGQLVLETERAWQSVGEISYGASVSEAGSLGFRRSLYVVEDIKAGEIFTTKNLRAIRPGYGLPPKFLDTALGRSARCNIARGTPLSWDLF